MLLQYKGDTALKDLRSKFGDVEAAGKVLVEVRIPSEHMVNKNLAVKATQLWGTDVYTDESDVVAVLMHTGFFNSAVSEPPPILAEVQVFLRILPAQATYQSSLRNSVTSRNWHGEYDGLSYAVERCVAISQSSGEHELKGNLEGEQIYPTVIPVITERVVKTRSTAASSEKKRVVQEVTLLYSLSNEPWYKYSMSAIADRGLDRSYWTSARLNTEVLYLESHDTRYEIAKVVSEEEEEADPADPPTEAFFRFAKVPIMAKEDVAEAGVPLPDQKLVVLQERLPWHAFLWSPQGVAVGEDAFPVVRMLFMKKTQTASADEEEEDSEEEDSESEEEEAAEDDKEGEGEEARGEEGGEQHANGDVDMEDVDGAEEGEGGNAAGLSLFAALDGGDGE